MKVEDVAAPEDLSSFRQQLMEIIENRPLSVRTEHPAWTRDQIADSASGEAAEVLRRGSPADRPGPQQGGQVACQVSVNREGEFLPLVPDSLPELGIRDTDIEGLILKFLMNCGPNPGAEIARQIRLPLPLISGVLRELKEERLVVYKSSAPAGDYVYEITESGCERTRQHLKQSTYFGAAPVSLEDYTSSVSAQSVRNQNPKIADLRAALHDLTVGEEVIAQLAQAANSGLGLFLYGASGNGKTSIASRITRAFGQAIWIPRAISVAGSIIRLYDPNSHEELPLDGEKLRDSGRIDQRWIRIRRPTIVVGGELTMDNLEVSVNRVTGISEAPIQLKSNCGTLAIDDFGRQRISPAELLNRWIMPLEKRHDILNLANGRKVEVPFDQLLVFSTNLEPRDLVDEAFLRRIPYKVDVKNPSEDEFRRLIRQLAGEQEIKYCDGPVDYLLAKYYTAAEREMRYCHPRDLLHQVSTYCTVLDLPREITDEAIDAAAKNYFSLL